MLVAILATGSRGDVLPMFALADGIRAHGHGVRLIVEQHYVSSAQTGGFEYRVVQGNSERFYRGAAGIALRESFSKPITETRRFWASYILPMTPYIDYDIAPYTGADAIVSHSWDTHGQSFAEKLKIPCFLASPLPLFQLPTSAFPFPISRSLDQEWSKSFNLKSWRRQIAILHIGHDVLQEWRQRRLGLRKLSFRESLAQLAACRHLLSYSPSLLPKPPEWGEGTTVTGYWFGAPPSNYSPPPELAEFLDKGEPPVAITFGSHITRDPVALTNMVVHAVRTAGFKALLLSGYGGLRVTGVLATATDVCQVEAVPFDWLLPRVAGLVHHAGSGTTAYCLRDDAPQVCIPFGFDQNFWANCLANKGLAPRPLSQRTLSAKDVGNAIVTAITSSSMRARTLEISRAMRREAGISKAVQAIVGCI